MRSVRVPIVLIALAIAITACGGTAGSPTPTPVPATPTASPTPSVDQATADLVAAAEASIDQGTVRIDQTILFEGSSLIPEGTSASAGGQATLSAPRQMRLTADFTELGQGELEMIVDGPLLYMHGAAFDQLAGAGNWLLVDLESNDPAAAPFKSLASGQNDVSTALFFLYGSTGTVDVEDGETIRGHETTHYTTEVDLEAARDTMPEEQAEALEDVIATLRVSGMERRLGTEAWVGEDGLVHRVLYEYRLGPTQGGGTMTTTIDFSGYGEPMELGIPDEALVVPIEDAGL